jgi:putative DNA primase/helicase
VKDTQASLYQWAAGEIQALGDVGSDAGKKARLATLIAVLNHCLRWEDARRISASLKLAESESGIPILPGDLDKDPSLLNVRNGTLNLRSGTLRPHCRSDYITKLAAVDYQPDATCPRWLKCLNKWMDGNKDLIQYLQRAVGYALTGDVGEQCLFFLHGSGQNGKTTFLGAILDMLGDYAIQTVAELLLERKYESHPTERADLCGRRFVATIETDEGKRMAEALMKQMTGGDKIRARQMRQDFFEFWPTHKFFLAANHKPVIQGTDLGTWRRIKLVPFTIAISDEEKDKSLGQKLGAEKAGILAWAVRGCLDWQQHGLGEPDEVRQATDAYREEEDVIAGFVAECCLVNREFKTQASVLLDTYQKWSGDKSMTTQGLKNRMEEKGYMRKRESTGVLSIFPGNVRSKGIRSRPC